MKLILLTLALLPIACEATLVYGPEGALEINQLAGGGYTVSSLNGGGTSVVTPVPNGLVIMSPDMPATFIDYTGEEAQPALPVVPVAPATDIMPPFRF